MGPVSYTHLYGYQNMAEYAYDPNQVFNIFGLSLGYGKRLEWPDDYFQLMASIGYQRYGLKNWTYNQFPCLLYTSRCV